MTGKELWGSILQKAMEGKLVPQRKEEGTAAELLKEIRKEKAKLVKEGKLKKTKPLPAVREEEKPFDIPDSWEWVRLRDIVYNHGQKKPTEKFSYIDIGSIDNTSQKLNDSEKIIMPEKAPSRARRIVQLGDILYATVRPYLHNMCIVDKTLSYPPIASTGFAVMATFEGVERKYLFYFLLSPAFDSYANSNQNAKGVAYPAINDKALYNALIPLPPLFEQHRIVEKLETLKPLVDAYGRAAEELDELNRKFPGDLKKSLLRQAMEGKLVPQRKEEGTAAELIKRLASCTDIEPKSRVELNTSAMDFEIPHTWLWVELNQIVRFVDYRGKTPTKTTKGVFLVTSSNVKRGYWDFSRKEYISRKEYEERKERGITEKGDIIFTTEAPMGNCAINELEECSCGQRLITFKEYEKNTIDLRFLMYSILSPAFQKELLDNCTGTTAKGIKAAKLKRLLLPLPPLLEQHRIAKKLESLLALCDKLQPED